MGLEKWMNFVASNVKIKKTENALYACIFWWFRYLLQIYDFSFRIAALAEVSGDYFCGGVIITRQKILTGKNHFKILRQ